MAQGNRLRSQRTFVRGPRRASSWARGPFGILNNIATSEVNLFPTGFQVVDNGITLVRTRGELLVSLLTASATGDGFLVAAGLCVVSENAFNAGVASVPDPLADMDWEGWFWYKTTNLLAAAISPLGNELGATINRIEIDSKAMRKIKSTDVIVGVIGTTENATATMNSALDTRMLFKLH